MFLSQVKRDGYTVGKWLLEDVPSHGRNLAFGVDLEVFLLQILVLAVVDKVKRD